MDLIPNLRLEEYHKEGMLSKDNIISISAKNNMNVEYLKERLYTLVVENPSLLDQTIISNSRHYEALQKSLEALGAVSEGLSSGRSGDMVALDIRQSLYHLGEITGEISTDDLLESIFSRFCIGK